MVGFHLASNARNFLHVVAHYSEHDVSGTVSVRDITAHVHTSDDRRVGIGAFPIAIDPTPFLVDIDKTEVRAELGNPDQIILGVDRLDYTKGILQRLQALEELHKAGMMPPRTVFLQIATPSRERIDHYRQTRNMVEQAVGRINGRFGSLGSQVVLYQHQSFDRERLVKLYATADIMLVTPFKDGMNLVAKEYVACHGDGSGALVLSEFAGAAEELSEAFLCNPFDVESIKQQLLAALSASPAEKQARMLRMHEQVISHDVNVWATAFLRCLTLG